MLPLLTANALSFAFGCLYGSVVASDLYANICFSCTVLMCVFWSCSSS